MGSPATTTSSTSLPFPIYNHSFQDLIQSPGSKHHLELTPNATLSPIPVLWMPTHRLPGKSKRHFFKILNQHLWLSTHSINSHLCSVVQANNFRIILDCFPPYSPHQSIGNLVSSAFKTYPEPRHLYHLHPGGALDYWLQWPQLVSPQSKLSSSQTVVMAARSCGYTKNTLNCTFKMSELYGVWMISP